MPETPQMPDYSTDTKKSSLLESSGYISLFESISDFFFIFDNSCRIIYINPRALEDLGYTMQELEGRQIHVLHPDEMKEAAKSSFREITEGKKTTCCIPLKAKNGNLIPAEHRAVRATFCGMEIFLGISRDISKNIISETGLLNLYHSEAAMILLSSMKDWHFIDVNQAFLNNTGFSRDEIIGRNCAELGLFADIDERDSGIKKLKKEGFIRNIEGRIRAKDGSIKHCIFSSDIIHTDGNASILTVMVDVTELKNAESARIDTESRYRTLFEKSMDAVAILGGSPPVFLLVNPAFEELVGYSSDEILAFSHDEMWKIIHPDDMGTVRNRLKSRFSGNSTPSRYEYRIVRKNGETRWIEVSANILKSGNDLISQNIYRDITERKISEKKLQEREEKLRAIFETVNSGIIIVDNLGIVQTVNRKMAELFACRPEDMPGMNNAELLSPEYMETGINEFRKLVSGETDRIYAERQYRRLDGSTFWGSITASRLLDKNGNLDGLLAMISDITERKITEDSIMERDALLGAVIENLPFDMWAIGKDSRYILQNETSRKNWGDITGKTTFELEYLADNETIELWHSNNKRVLDGEKIFEEASYRIKEKTYHFINAMNPVRKKDSVIGAIGFNIDITDRKITEEVVKARFRISEYAASHSIMELLQKSLDEMEKLTESQISFFHFVNENEKSVLLQAWSSNTITNMCMAAPGQYHYPVEAAGVWADCIRQRQKIVHNCYSSVPGRKTLPDGHVRLTRELTVPVFNGDTIVAVIGVANKDQDYDDRDASVIESLGGMIWDIIRRKMAEEEKAELEKRLLHTQKLESLGIMAGGIAHDFNNLLMAITGNLEFSLMELPEDSPVIKVINQAMAASRRAADLTRQMLAYSGRGHFIIKHIDISELVRENVDILKTVISKSACLFMDLDPGLPLISADAGQIQQIIMNLITNASEAIGENSGEIWVTTGVEKAEAEYLKKSRVDVKINSGMFVFLEVSDTGCGMNQETQDRLFDPFFTTKFTGRGLGMSAVLGIVKGHSGAMMIESTQGGGTNIKVLFPVPDETFLRKKSSEDTKKITEAEPCRKGSVLVVDDEEMILNICRIALEKSGYSVITASDGEEAVAVFKNHHNSPDTVIDCVVLDLNMPKMDGITAFRNIKKIRTDTRVILTSGYTEIEAAGLFAEEHLDCFIQKPYQIKALIKEIEKLTG